MPTSGTQQSPLGWIPIRIKTCFLTSEAVGDFAGDLVEGDPFLNQGISVPEGDGLVLGGLAVDGEAERRADFILPTVTPADGSLLIEGGIQPGPFEITIQFCRDFGHPFFFDQGENRRLDRCQSRMQLQHGARLQFSLFIRLLIDVIRLAEKGQRGPIGPGGRFDHMGNKAFAGLVVEVAQVLATAPMPGLPLIV